MVKGGSLNPWTLVAPDILGNRHYAGWVVPEQVSISMLCLGGQMWIILRIC